MEPLEPTGAGSTRQPRAHGDAFDRALAALTGSQRQAVDSPSEALCIIAGAGSGKTRVLTLRTARRIRDGSADADHSLICTFTRRAARELRHRLALYGVAVSTPAPAGGAPTPGVRAGTLHQLALHLLRLHALDAGRPPPVVADHRYRTVRDLVGDPAVASAVDAEIGWAKANCLTASSYADAARAAGRPAVISIDQVVDSLRRLRGLAPTPAHARPRRHAPAAPPTSSATTPASPSACSGGTGTSRSTNSRT